MTQTLDTINTRFARAAQKYPDRPCLTHKPSGSKTWETLTYKDVAEQVRCFALGLSASGIEAGDRVALLSDNRPEWAIADMAILALGVASVPIYPTLPASQVAHILADSGAKAVLASDSKQMAKVESARKSTPALALRIIADSKDAGGEDVQTFAAILDLGRAASGDGFEARRDAVQPDALLSLVYTSGTTGNPKGVMLTQGCLVAAVDAAFGKFEQFQPPEDVFLSFLPLSHIYERVTHYLSITLGAHTVYNDSVFKLMDNLAEWQPTVMQCVPRVFESIHERVADGVAKLPARRQRLTHWALGIGDAVAAARNTGRRVPPLLRIQAAAADPLILSKIRARFGGKLKFFVSGGAPLNPKTAHFFLAAGIPILEGWGLTETAGAAAANPFGHVKVGTVGTPMPGVEVKVGADGELMVHGPTVMRGYWNNPEATAEALDPDGGFHTGDIGEIDAQGYVKITDRKKDILVLANGKKVAPQPIETRLKHSPLLAEVVLLGDNSGTVGALVVPSFDALKAWAKEQNLDAKTNEALIAHPAARKRVKTEIDSLSKDLADFEKIKRIALIDHAFTQDGGELTPTLKVKRKVVAEKYGALLDKQDKDSG